MTFKWSKYLDEAYKLSHTSNGSGLGFVWIEVKQGTIEVCWSDNEKLDSKAFNFDDQIFKNS